MASKVAWARFAIPKPACITPAASSLHHVTQFEWTRRSLVLLQAGCAVWQRNVQRYAALLLAQLQAGHIWYPFHRGPPDGPLPNLPPWILAAAANNSTGRPRLVHPAACPPSTGELYPSSVQVWLLQVPAHWVCSVAMLRPVLVRMVLVHSRHRQRPCRRLRCPVAQHCPDAFRTCSNSCCTQSGNQAAASNTHQSGQPCSVCRRLLQLEARWRDKGPYKLLSRPGSCRDRRWLCLGSPTASSAEGQPAGKQRAYHWLVQLHLACCPTSSVVIRSGSTASLRHHLLTSCSCTGICGKAAHVDLTLHTASSGLQGQTVNHLVCDDSRCSIHEYLAHPKGAKAALSKHEPLHDCFSG